MIKLFKSLEKPVFLNFLGFSRIACLSTTPMRESIFRYLAAPLPLGVTRKLLFSTFKLCNVLQLTKTQGYYVNQGRVWRIRRRSKLCPLGHHSNDGADGFTMAALEQTARLKPRVLRVPLYWQQKGGEGNPWAARQHALLSYQLEPSIRSESAWEERKGCWIAASLGLRCPSPN